MINNEILLEITSKIGLILLIIGSLFIFTSAIATLKMKDTLLFSLSIGINDSFGAPMVIIGAGLYNYGISLITLKFFLAALFLLFTSPASIYSILNSYLINKNDAN